MNEDLIFQIIENSAIYAIKTIHYAQEIHTCTFGIVKFDALCENLRMF